MKLTLECIIGERAVDIRVLNDRGTAVSVFNFDRGLIDVRPETRAEVQGWTPDADAEPDAAEQVGAVLRKIAQISDERPQQEQLDMLLHLSLHNLVVLAKEALK